MDVIDLGVLDKVKPYDFDSATGKGKCNICDVNFTSAEHANTHLRGGPHRRKLEKLKGNQTKDLTMNIYKCDLCKKTFTGIESKAQHFQSVKHKKKLEELKFLDSPESLRGIAFCIEETVQTDTPTSHSVDSKNIEDSPPCSLIDSPSDEVLLQNPVDPEPTTKGRPNSANNNRNRPTIHLEETDFCCLENKGITLPTPGKNLDRDIEINRNPTCETCTGTINADGINNTNKMFSSPETWCNTCDAPLSGVASARAHYAGKPHKKKLTYEQFYNTTPISVSSRLDVKSKQTSEIVEGQGSSIYDPGFSTHESNILSKTSLPVPVMGEEPEEPDPLNKNPSVERWCETCEVPFSGPLSAREHYSGKQHKKKLHCRRQLYFPNASDSSSKMETSANTSQFKNKHTSDETSNNLLLEEELPGTNDLKWSVARSGDGKDAEKWCEICKVPFSSIINAKQHYAGKLHKKQLQKRELMAESFLPSPEKFGSSFLDQQSNTDAEKVSEDYQPKIDEFKESENLALSSLETSVTFCGVCHVPFSCSENAMEHYKGKKHQRTLQLLHPGMAIVKPYQDSLSQEENNLVDQTDETEMKRNVGEMIKQIKDVNQRVSTTSAGADDGIFQAVNKFYMVLNQDSVQKQEDGQYKMKPGDQPQCSGPPEDLGLNADDKIKSLNTIKGANRPTTEEVNTSSGSILSSQNDEIICNDINNCIKEFCPICRVPFSCLLNAKQHYDGKPHKKQIKVLKSTDPSSKLIQIPYLTIVDSCSREDTFPLESLTDLSLVPSNQSLKQHKACQGTDLETL